MLQPRPDVRCILAVLHLGPYAVHLYISYRDSTIFMCNVCGRWQVDWGSKSRVRLKLTVRIGHDAGRGGEVEVEVRFWGQGEGCSVAGVFLSLWALIWSCPDLQTHAMPSHVCRAAFAHCPVRCLCCCTHHLHHLRSVP